MLYLAYCAFVFRINAQKKHKIEIKNDDMLFEDKTLPTSSDVVAMFAAYEYIAT